jgi:type IV pilus assembly protein PilB
MSKELRGDRRLPVSAWPGATNVRTNYMAPEQGTFKSDDAVLFGERLIAKGLVTQRQVFEALKKQRLDGGRLGEVLLRLKMLTEKDVTSTLAEHLAMETIVFDDISKINMDVARLLPESIARRFCLVAIGESNGDVVVAMADPLNVIALDTIKLRLRRTIKTVLSSPEQIHKAIEMIYHGSDVEEQRLREIAETVDIDMLKVENEPNGESATEADISVEVEATKAPVIQFVDLLLSQAVKSRASDIHIEPMEKSMSIRMRVDGLLRDMVPPARKMQMAVITRVKILSKMDIAERRLPQDGRFKIKAPGRDIDVRVSALPTIYGEKVVMRLLDKAAVNHNLDTIGFDEKYLKEYKAILEQPHGIIIVTGPTGSGKSTTLYSSLNYLKDPKKNITTVEDPVEYRLAGINQVQVKPEIDMDFAAALRAILRQDPDIILIGEIRDKETVEIAIKASLTGHLVLSTFHTNDSPSAISRLAYMGIERYLLASTLNLIIAQRLVRRICEKCKEPVKLDDIMLKRLKISDQQAKKAVFYHGKGCPTCDRTGYFGRLPIFEFLTIDNQMREMIVNSATEAQIRAAARKKGYGGLLESGVSRMLQGLTTAEEVIGTTFMEDIQV